MAMPDSTPVRFPLMNDTKWRELRSEMLKLDPAPQYRTVDLHGGHVSGWDGEWFHHFHETDYAWIERCELACPDDAQRNAVRDALARVGVPAEEIDAGFVVFGHGVPGVAYRCIGDDGA